MLPPSLPQIGCSEWDG